MRRLKEILLLLLYLSLFVFTIVMEQLSILNVGQRLLVNGATLLMTLISGALVLVIMRGFRDEKEAHGKQEELQKRQPKDGLEPELQGRCTEREEPEKHKKNCIGKELLNEHAGGRAVYAGQTDDRRENIGEKYVFDKKAYLEFAMQYELTRRETEIGILLLNDCTNLQISEDLFIAETTVKKHLTHIYEKTNTTGRKDFKERVKECTRKE